MMYTAEVTASSLNIRSIPNNEGRIIGSLYRGQKILVTSTSDEWVKTILEGNEIGYISSIYLVEDFCCIKIKIFLLKSLFKTTFQCRFIMSLCKV